MGRLLDEDDVIDAVSRGCQEFRGIFARCEKNLNELPPAQPERIQNNAVHLCDSCQYTYVTCPSHGNDAVFGDGKGNDNICACNKYRPISAQPEREKGKWIVEPDGRLRCSVCSEIPTNRIIAGGYLIYDIAPIRKYMKFCPTCGSYNGGDGERNEIN